MQPPMLSTPVQAGAAEPERDPRAHCQAGSGLASQAPRRGPDVREEGRGEPGGPGTLPGTLVPHAGDPSAEQ